jgi:HK97 gp10 family phage protein
MLRLDPALQNEVCRYLVRWAADVQVLAKQLVPVKSGYLRSTIYAVVKEWMVSFGADATYAYFVEAGTKYMQAKPYLFPALQEYLPQLEQIIIVAIESAKTEAGLT